MTNKQNPGDGTPPPFLYGSHYSTPGFVLYYLVRVPKGNQNKIKELADGGEAPKTIADENDEKVFSSGD